MREIQSLRAEQSRAEQLSCVKVIGQMDNTIDHTFESANRVYDDNGIALTVNTCGGGGLQPKVVDIKKISNCIGGISDSIWGTQYHQQDRVYQMQDIALAHPANIPGGSYKYLEVKKMGEKTAKKATEKTAVKIRQATKDGFIECPIGGVADLSYPTSQLRRGRVQGNGQISPTLTTENIPSLIELGDPDFYNFLYEIDGEIYLIRIRKLTEIECGRLMGFAEKDIEAMTSVNSRSQCYKECGNSIVISVLCAIFSQFFEGKEWDGMSDAERYDLIDKGCYVGREENM